ncbi:MAG: thioredoxin family protein [Acidobacteria bacterium]|nr:thioredoxin family protein [Acidobacteriota bacterium]
MKKYAFALFALILLIFPAAAQKKPAVRHKKPRAVFTRKKFDPARQPQADLDKAIAAAAASGKRIILDVGGEWCSWCVYMDKFFFRQPALRKVRDTNYIWVKINMSPENENTAFLSSYPAIDDYPHLFVLDETGKLLFSKDTAELELGEGYSVSKFTAFLKEWIKPRPGAPPEK